MDKFIVFLLAVAVFSAASKAEKDKPEKALESAAVEIVPELEPISQPEPLPVIELPKPAVVVPPVKVPVPASVPPKTQPVRSQCRYVWTRRGWVYTCQ